MRVAVTGGHGFIGTAVRKELLRRGHAVLSLDRRLGVDVLGPDLAYHIEGEDAVVHLAGVLGTEELFTSPYEAIRVNIEGTTRVLESCRLAGAKFLGITMPDVWANVYQATKRAAFDMATAWHVNYDVPVAHVLAYNVFGRGQKVHGVQKIIPTFAHRSWRNEPLPVWGTGMQFVDLVPVEYVAEVFADTLENGEFKGETVHAGSGIAQTVIDVAQRINDWTGNPAGIEYLPMRKGEQGSIAVAPEETMSCDVLNRQLRDTVNWYVEDRP